MADEGEEERNRTARNGTARAGRTASPASSGHDPADLVGMAELQDEVMTAVRGAITGVIARRVPDMRLPELDLDFSLAAPVDRGQPAPPAPPENAASTALMLDPRTVAERRSNARPHRSGRPSLVVITACLAVVAASGYAAWHAAFVQDLPLTRSASAGRHAPPGDAPGSAFPAVASLVPMLDVAPDEPKVTAHAGELAAIDPAADPPLATTGEAGAPSVKALPGPPLGVLEAPETPSVPVTAKPDLNTSGPADGSAASSGTAEPADRVQTERTAAADQAAQTEPIADAIKDATQLIESGAVAAARAVLLAHWADHASADTALALARSFDPQYLAALPNADAGPDAAEAERWYRRWYDIAVKEGLVAGTVPLERVLRAMR